MKILLADDERPALARLEKVVRKEQPDAEIFPFNKTGELLDFANENTCDIAFLDIEMRGITGIELAKRLKDITPSINIIFVTSYSEYMGAAFGLHASGYILKPVTEEAVDKEIQNLRFPVMPKLSRIRVQTFGNFEILVDNRPLTFRRNRAKEILAYLVDRKGATASIAEIAGVLFEDRMYDRSLQKQMQVFVTDLINALKEAGAPEVVIRGRNSLSVDPESFSCDYYDFLKFIPYAVNAYHGEYMANYSWAEFTTSWLNQCI